jgi:hypothetical protein
MFRPSGAALFIVSDPMAHAMGYRSIAAPRLFLFPKALRHGLQIYRRFDAELPACVASSNSFKYPCQIFAIV